MVDETRQGEFPKVWDNAPAYIDAVRTRDHRDYWQDQPNYVELWGEKSAVLGSLRPVADKWGLALRVCRGFGGTGMEDSIGRLFEGIDKPITVLYVDDHDASGVLIDREFHQRVETASGVKIKLVRLAILPDDIHKFKLPPQKITDKDTRAAAFRKKFGKHAATVEALPVVELRRRIERAVKGIIEFERWNRQASTEKAESDSISRVAEAFKKAKHG